MPSNVDKVRAEVAHKIDFTSGAAQRKELDRRISGEKGRPGIRTRAGNMSSCEHNPTLSDLSPLLSVLHTHSKAVCLTGMEDYYQHYTDPVPPRILPKSLLQLHDTGKYGCELSLLQQHCEGLADMTAVNKAQAALVEAETKRQYLSPAWYALRAGRITASNIHAIVSTSVSKPAISTVRKVCYPNKSATTAAIRWGIEHEEEGRQAYITVMAPQHENLKVEQSGFKLNPSFPEVGASPDGLIHCTCCGKGCLEVKCTFKHCNTHILQACEDDMNFYLQVTDGKISLKKTHPYYSQVQTQIFVTESKFCDFVVWTVMDCVVVRILPDAGFWSMCLPKAQEFFLKVCLPELVAHHYTGAASTTPHVKPLTGVPQTSRTDPPMTSRPRKQALQKIDKLWCLCRGPEGLDDMVACDNENCVVQWFHLRCVGLSEAPSASEPWLCATCTQTG